MAQFFDNIYDAVFDPTSGMRRIAAQRPLGQSLVAVFFSIVIPTATLLFSATSDSMEKMFTIVILLQTIGSFLVWFIGTAILGLIAELFGGKGSSLGLFTAMGFAHIPRIIVVPLLVLASLLSSEAGAVLGAVAVVGVLCWTLFLDVAAIKGAYELSTAKATLVLITPLLVITMLVITIAVFLGTACLSGQFW